MEKVRSLFFLHAPDDVKAAYSALLKSHFDRVAWFSSISRMVKSAALKRPAVTVIDLDRLKAPVEPLIEQFRSNLPESDLIALSSDDSAQLALHCLRSGFSDFLLKPVSPEELTWSIRKCEERRELVERIETPRTYLVRAITQISSGTTPLLVRTYALESLAHLLQAEGSAWLTTRTKDKIETLCAVPRNLPADATFEAPLERMDKRRSRPLILFSKKRNERRVVLPCTHDKSSTLFLWGVHGKLPAKSIEQARLLVEHAERCLMNLQKLDEIRKQTFIDDLTGLFNSRYLKFALASAVTRAKNAKEKFSLLFIDVDHFKSVNDRYGHLVGSDFLITLGKTVKNAVRNDDLVFRYGGDEFVVLLQTAAVSDALEIANRIRKNIEKRVFSIRGQKIQATVSIGIATYPDHTDQFETLLTLADHAMYGAKKAERNAIHLAKIPVRRAEETK